MNRIDIDFWLQFLGLVAAVAAPVLLFLILSGCVALPPAVSAAGGWYTHDRIDRLETGRIEALEERMREIEEAR